ncbi:hypothetical protein Naga_101819g1 [Nannochloropsis gaditana]|uniref:Secreted protein n=1 Tax=Nannochloropsis gaditana TaxID=72520 RepID=W7TGM9_9STRA|nr:hypothetical protein Naga_101819g1 [Nannochloropsis gaditana]
MSLVFKCLVCGLTARGSSALFFGERTEREAGYVHGRRSRRERRGFSAGRGVTCGCGKNKGHHLSLGCFLLTGSPPSRSCRVTRGGGRDWGGASAQERREAGPRGGGRRMIDNLARGVYVSGPTASQGSHHGTMATRQALI